MTFRGWLLDLYLNRQEGLTLWFIGEDDRRVCFRQTFPVTFYAVGQKEQLRAFWKYVSGKPGVLSPVSYTHLRAHETPEHLVCRLLLEKKKNKQALYLTSPPLKKVQS